MTEGTSLHTPFIFTYMRRGKGSTAGTGKPAEEGGNSSAGNGAPHPYESAIKQIAIASTVEEFWEVYDFMKRPNDLPTTTDLHMFRSGITPTWEDPANAKGGKWIVRLPKGLASRYWEEIVLALIGEQFTGVPDQEICGAVLSVRYSEDILGVWNATATDRDVIDRIRDAIKKILQLPPQATMEYKPHQASIQDRSSFRNTQAWKPKINDRNRSGSWSEQESRKKRNERDTGKNWR